MILRFLKLLPVLILLVIAFIFNILHRFFELLDNGLMEFSYKLMRKITSK